MLAQCTLQLCTLLIGIAVIYKTFQSIQAELDDAVQTHRNQPAGLSPAAGPQSYSQNC